MNCIQSCVLYTGKPQRFREAKTGDFSYTGKKFLKNMSGHQKLSKLSPKQHPVNEVTKSGFFVDITFQFLQNYQNKEDGDIEVDQLLVICLGHFHVRSLGQIGTWCPNLLVCNLPNNHLTSVSAFHGCVNLIKLDIHGNQLSRIPDEGFWSKMKHLEFLYLHDNPIASVDTVNRLTICPKLTALTMYDTPLSLMDRYRHHVVNSLIALKALDHYVIADQEIIEDLNATERFAAFKQVLKINLCPSLNQKISTSEALQQVTGTRRCINNIMAHHSPVIIIQKFIRSFLTRQRLKKLPKTGLMVTTSSDPSSKNNLQLQNIHTTCIAPIIPTHDLFQSRAENSSHSSVFPFAPPQSPQSQQMAPKYSTHLPDLAQLPSINDMLMRLNGTGDGTLFQKIQSKISSGEENQKTNNNACETKKSNKPSTKCLNKTDDSFSLTFTGNSIPFSNFCLQGLKKAVLSTDAFSEFVLNQQNTGTAIRNIHTKFHQSPDSDEKFRTRKTTALNERFQGRILKQVNLSRLFAIQQAYQDQQVTNSRKKRMKETQQRKTERQFAQERRHMLQEERRYVTLQDKQLFKNQIHQGMKQNAVKQTEYLGKQRENRDKSRRALSTTEEDVEFMQEFAKRQIGISRLLLKHDKLQLLKEEALQKTMSVRELQDQLQSNQERIKTFKKQKIQALQIKNNVQNDKIRNKFAKISKQVLMESQRRVAQLKGDAKKETVPYDLPLITVNEYDNEKNENVDEQNLLEILQ